MDSMAQNDWGMSQILLHTFTR